MTYVAFDGVAMVEIIHNLVTDIRMLDGPPTESVLVVIHHVDEKHNLGRVVST